MIYKKIIRKFCLLTWKIWEKLGIHIVPDHFYFPYQNSKKLEEHDFDARFPLDGIKFNLEDMKKIIFSFGKYNSEYETIHQDSSYATNGDGAILYSMIRSIKPQKIIEVGSGYSTLIMHEALKLNQKESQINYNITSIEPYPITELVESAKNQNITLVQEKVESLDVGIFKQLNKNDILFIDSSHVVDIGNDVHYLYLKVLPQIPVGTYIHIHDIRFPYEYPKKWVLNERKNWCEQYLLHMFLAFNDNFEIILASNYLYQLDGKLMSENLYGLKETGNGWPGSFWIKRVK